MSHTTVWRNRDHDLDLTPALLHEEALGGAERWSGRVAVLDAATGGSVTYAGIADGSGASPPACALVARGAATS